MTQRFSLSFFLLLAALLAGCQFTPETELRVGTNIWPGYEPLYLARSLNLLPDGARLVEYPASTETIRALRDGMIEAGALTLDEVLTLRAGGADVRVVLVMDESAGADAVIARGEIAAPGDLKGRRLGAETTALGAWMTHLLLEKAGLKAEDVNIAPLPADEQEDAFLQGKVDAVVTFEPVKSRLLTQGAKLGAHVIFDSREVPGRIVDVLAVRADALKAHPKGLRKLLAAWFRALDFMRRHPDEAARRIAPRLGLTPEQTRQAFAGLHLPDLAQNRALLGADGAQPALAATARDMRRIMRQARLLTPAHRKRAAASPLFDASFLPGPAQ